MPREDADPERRCCLNCHFLKKWSRESNTDRECSLEVTREERRQLAHGVDATAVIGGRWSLACHQDVWDSANFRIDSCRDIQKVTSEERGESCFFYPHTPGMFFPASVELERRQADRREARRDRQLVKWSIIAALIGALVGAALGAILTAVVT